MTIAASHEVAPVPWSLFTPGSQNKFGQNNPGSESTGRPLSFASVTREDPRYLDKVGQDRPRGAPPPVSADNSGAPVQVAENDDFFGEDGFTFDDFLDIVNPLQHIPIVSSIYRNVTGDDISQGARLAGATLYGGPIGLAGAVANNAVEAHTGKDIGENALALLFGEDTPDAASSALASASPTPVATPQSGTSPAGTSPAATSPAATSQSATSQSATAAVAVEQLAAISPAAGTAVPNGDVRLFGLNTQPSFDLPQQPAGGIAATGFVTPAPTTVSKPVTTPRASAEAQTFNTNTAPVETALQTAARAPTAPAQPVAVTPAPQPIALPPRTPQPAAPQAPAASDPNAANSAPPAPTQLSPSAARRLMEMAQESAAPQPESAASAAPQQPSPQQIPDAMLSALKKYEEMQRNPG